MPISGRGSIIRKYCNSGDNKSPWMRSSMWQKSSGLMCVRNCLGSDGLILTTWQSEGQKGDIL